MAAYSKKVCLLGEFAVGKTSLVKRFVYDRFDDDYLSTIGVKVSRKTVTVFAPKNNSASSTQPIELTMMLWDLAGSEAFNQIRTSYTRGAAGAILVCDLTRAETLDSLQQYIKILLRTSPNAKLIIVANKDDLVDEHELTEEDIAQFAAKFNAPYFLSSAKVGDNVDQLFRVLGEKLVG
ncbi:MAG: Rab family GTPase [Chloroflexota bacterium]